MTNTASRKAVVNEAARGALRNLLFLGLEELLIERPWSAITMTHIARRSGVSRQTLYNEFGSRDAFIAAYVLWASDQFLDEVERTVDANRESLEGALSAALTHILTLASEHPLIRGLEATTGEQGLLALVAGNTGRALLSTATGRLIGIIERTWPRISEADRSMLAEIIVRLSLSHLLVSTHTPEDAAALVAQALRPYFATMIDREETLGARL